MTARLVLPAGMDRTAEWYEERLKGVTASEIAVILGLSPFRESEFSLFWRKLGEIPPIEDNDIMSLGRHLESWVADKFATDHPDLELIPGGLYGNTARPYQLATPDRLIRRIGGGSEIVAAWEGKTAGSPDGWGMSGTDEVPVYYRAQTLWQMDCLDLRRIYLSCLFLDRRQTRHYVIDYDEVDVTVLRLAAQDFVERLTRGEPPPVDGSDAARAALKHLHPAVVEDRTAVIPTALADAYRAACFAVADAHDTRDELENQVRAQIGAAQIVLDETERKVCTRSIYQVGPSVREGYTVDKLNPPRRPKKKRA